MVLLFLIVIRLSKILESLLSILHIFVFVSPSNLSIRSRIEEISKGSAKPSFSHSNELIDLPSVPIYKLRLFLLSALATSGASLKLSMALTKKKESST